MVNEATKLTISSGVLVPKATTVSPIIRGVSPARIAKEALPRTRPSAPTVSAASPRIKRQIFRNIASPYLIPNIIY